MIYAPAAPGGKEVHLDRRSITSNIQTSLPHLDWLVIKIKTKQYSFFYSIHFKPGKKVTLPPTGFLEI